MQEAPIATHGWKLKSRPKVATPSGGGGTTTLQVQHGNYPGQIHLREGSQGDTFSPYLVNDITTIAGIIKEDVQQPGTLALHMCAL